MKTTLFILLLIATLAYAQEKHKASADCFARIVPVIDTVKVDTVSHFLKVTLIK